MMQTKLGLTQKEVMNTPWISLIIAINDFPYYHYKSKDEPITGKKAAEHLQQYIR
jgi:hypothetical protein